MKRYLSNREWIKLGFMLMLILMVSTAVKAEDKEYQGYTYHSWSLEDKEETKGVAISGYKGSDSILAIPDTINGNKVIMVRLSKLSNRSNVEKIILPQYVSEIYYDDYYETDSSIQQNYEAIIKNCPKLNCIEVADSNKALTDKDGILYNATMTELYYCPPAKTGSITIPETVTRIRKCAFFGCSELTSVTIPKLVNKLDEAVFGDNNKLASIKVDNANSSFKTIDNIVFSKDGETLYAYPEGKKNVRYSIPEGVNMVERGAFMYNEKLQNITMPSTLELIGNDAFSYCVALRKVVLKKGLRSIDAGAFTGCKKLTSIKFYDGMRKIQEDAFTSCTGLKNVIIPKTVIEVSKNLLIGTNRTVKIYNSNYDGYFTKADAKIKNYKLYAYKDSLLYKIAQKAGVSVKVLKVKKDTAVTVNKIKTSDKVKKGTGKPDISWYKASAKLYKINTPDQLAGLAKLVNKKISFKGKKIQLTADIDLKCYKNWVPIGSEIDEEILSFQGSFDGQGHCIYNLTTIDSTKNFQALFGYTGTKSKIKNLNLKGANIKGNSYTAVLVGANGAAISNCDIAGAVNGYEHVGGIAASSNYVGAITKCTFTGKVKGVTNVGGIVGTTSSDITECRNKGAIDGNESVGGVSGVANGGELYQCINSGHIKGDSQVGGICGNFRSDQGISKGENKGTVTGKKYVGGVTGMSGFFNGVIKNVVNKGEIKGDYYVGGITGYIAVGHIDKCTNRANIIGISRVGGIIGQIGKIDPSEDRYTDCGSTGKVIGNNRVGEIYGEELMYF